MRLLIVIPILSSNVGGMERFVIEFSTRLASSGHDVTIITGRKGGDLQLDGVKIIRHRLFFPRYFSKLIKYAHISWIARSHLKKNKYDAVLAMGHSGLFLKGFIWRASGSPVPMVREARRKMRISSLSRMIISLDLFTQERMERACIRKATCHMFPSMSMKSDYERIYGFSAGRYFIPCSGTGSEYAATDQELDILLNTPGLKILTVDGLSAETKGRDLIIDAFSRMDIGCSFLVAAGRVDEEKLKEPLLSRTIRLGRVEFSKMPAVYKSCDFLIFPSLTEGFPNVLLEAAYYGLPIISSRLEGIEEYFTDGRDILLVEKGDPKGLAQRIEQLSNSVEMRRKLSENAMKRAKAIDYRIFAKEFVSFVSSDKVKDVNLLATMV